MMKKAYPFLVLALVSNVSWADAPAPPADVILNKVLESDPWGLGDAAVTAHATLTDKSGSKSELAFTARSKRLTPVLSESLVRFSAPPDLAGAGFLQIQKKDGDDDRFLFLPDLKRSRRISGNLRANAFMGTDLSFADLDRRDLRDGVATFLRSEPVEKWDCFVIDVVPKQDSQYSHAELWVRKDAFIPLKMKLYDRSKVLLKSFQALEVKRINSRWFISRSKMTNNQQNHSTELVLSQISTSEKFDDGEFTVRALEKTQ